MGLLKRNLAAALIFCALPPAVGAQTPSRETLAARFFVAGHELRLKVDTGADVSALERKIVRKLGLAADPDFSFQVRSFHGANLGTSGANLAVKLGGVPMSESTPFVFLPRLTGVPGRIRGILGIRPLREAGAVVDVSGGTIALTGGDHAAGGERLKLLTSTQRPFVFVVSRYRGRELVWMVDTGAETSVLTRNSAARLKIAAERQQHRRLADTSGKSREAVRAILEAVEWGTRLRGDLPVLVGQVPSLAGVRAGGKPADGILGLDFLAKHGAVIDFRAGFLTLRASGARPRRS